MGDLPQPPDAPDVELTTQPSEEHWQWRWRMAEALAARCDLEALGVAAIYVIGSTKDATAGPRSDIDLLVHHDGNATTRSLAESYFRGWSHCLAEWNQARTGQPSGGLLEAHFITEADIAAQTSYAAMIDSWTNRARLLRKRG
jgi:pyruvate,water dikinase